MGSKHLLKIKNRIEFFDSDLELMDAIHKMSHKSQNSCNELFTLITKPKHPVLGNKKKCKQTYDIAIHHLRNTIYAGYLKDLYEEFSEYLRNILKEAYDSSLIEPQRVTGDNNFQMKATEILRMARDGVLEKYIIDSIFQTLENERSTLNLISKICNKIGIAVSDTIRDEAIYYLDIRHKLVHTDGFADSDFQEKHKSLKYSSDGFIELQFRTLKMARTKILCLVNELDKECMAKGLLKSN